MIATQHPVPSHLSVPTRGDPMELSSGSERRRVMDDDIDIDIDIDFASDHAPDAEDEAMVEQADFDIVEDIAANPRFPGRQDDEMLDDEKVDSGESMEDKFLIRHEDFEDLEDAFQDDEPELYIHTVSTEGTQDNLDMQKTNHEIFDEETTTNMSRQIEGHMYHDIANDQPNPREADFGWSDEPIQQVADAKEYLDTTEELLEAGDADHELGISVKADQSPNTPESGDPTSASITNVSVLNSSVAQSTDSIERNEQDKPNGTGLVTSTVPMSDAALISSPYLHPIVVRYGERELSLFPPVEQDQENTMDYFLEDESYMDECINELLVAIRSVLAHDVSEQDELEISIEALGLVICESALESNTATLAQILDVYLQLQGHDGLEDPEPLYVALNFKPSFSHRMQYLYAAAAEGKGLSRLSEVEPSVETTTAIKIRQEEDPVFQNVLPQADTFATAPVELAEDTQDHDDRIGNRGLSKSESGSDRTVRTDTSANTFTAIDNFHGDITQIDHKEPKTSPDLASSEVEEKVIVEPPFLRASSLEDLANLAPLLSQVVHQINEDLIDYDTDDDPFDNLSTETSTLHGDAPNAEAYGVETGSDVNSRTGGYEESPNPTRNLEELKHSAIGDDLVFDDEVYATTNKNHTGIKSPQTASVTSRKAGSVVRTDKFNDHVARSTAHLNRERTDYGRSDALPQINSNSSPAAETADPSHLDVDVSSSNGMTSQSLEQHDSLVLDTENYNKPSSHVFGDNQAQANLQNTFDEESFLQDSNGTYQSVDLRSLHGNTKTLEDLEDEFDYNDEELQQAMSVSYDKDAELEPNVAQSPGITNGNLDEITDGDDDDGKPTTLLPANNAGSSPTSLKRLRTDDEGAPQGKLKDIKRVRAD